MKSHKYLILLWISCFLGFAEEPPPHIFIISVDTLRADHLSSYGYHKPTSPNIDGLLARGVRFTQARTNEPLTAPALTTMLTALYPHEHGASRNGLPIYPNLPSVSKILSARGYRTAAFVGNWTLRDGITGLAEHFDVYNEVFTRKRWFGLFADEANANDLTKKSLSWLKKQDEGRPVFLWVHYVDPHAPYRFHQEFAQKLDLTHSPDLPKADRYDTEIAFTDHQIGILLSGLAKFAPPERSLILFLSDHGESLGEHDYWGHGRHLYEPTLHIPMGIVWEGVIEPGVVTAPAVIIDVPATILGLTDQGSHESFRGLNWGPILLDQGEAPEHRITFYQAHKGAVQQKRNAERGRQKGLLEVALVQDGIKETFRVKSMARRLFDLDADPLELNSLVKRRSELSDRLKQWALDVEKGLNEAMDRQPELDDRDVEMLRSLGYIE